MSLNLVPLAIDGAYSTLVGTVDGFDEDCAPKSPNPVRKAIDVINPWDALTDAGLFTWTFYRVTLPFVVKPSLTTDLTKFHDPACVQPLRDMLMAKEPQFFSDMTALPSYSGRWFPDPNNASYKEDSVQLCSQFNVNLQFTKEGQSRNSSAVIFMENGRALTYSGSVYDISNVVCLYLFPH